MPFVEIWRRHRDIARGLRRAGRRCLRHGRVSVAKLIERHGADVKLPDADATTGRRGKEWLHAFFPGKRRPRSPQRARPNLPLTAGRALSLAMTRAGEMPMTNALPRDEYMRLLYEQAAPEQRQLAERVRAAHRNGILATDSERSPPI